MPSKWEGALECDICWMEGGHLKRRVRWSCWRKGQLPLHFEWGHLVSHSTAWLTAHCKCTHSPENRPIHISHSFLENIHSWRITTCMYCKQHILSTMTYRLNDNVSQIGFIKYMFTLGKLISILHKQCARAFFLQIFRMISYELYAGFCRYFLPSAVALLHMWLPWHMSSLSRPERINGFVWAMHYVCRRKTNAGDSCQTKA